MPNLVRGAALGSLVLAGCASVNTSGSTTGVCTDLTAQQVVPSADWQGSVFTVVMENRSRRDILGNKNAPFINALASQNAVAAGYVDNFVHPSEPNYIWMVAGQNFGILDNQWPVDNHIASRSHIADQLEMQGMSWRAYMESMGAPCGLVSSYPYEPKHNPFVFFDDINGWDGKAFHPDGRCAAHVVDYRELDRDLAAGTVPRYVFITPNMKHNMHDGSVAEGDAWLAQELPKILASDAFNHGGVVFLTWDEGTDQRDDPPMIVISPNARRGAVSHTTFNASSYLKTVQKILGLEPLPCDTANRDTIETMDELFDVPLD